MATRPTEEEILAAVERQPAGRRISTRLTDPGEASLTWESVLECEIHRSIEERGTEGRRTAKGPLSRNGRIAERPTCTSALVRILKRPARGPWEKPLEEGLIARCPLTEVGFLHSARNAEDRTEPVRDLDAVFGWAPLDDRAVIRAWDVQRELTEKGRHRSAGAVDPLVAATAELQGLTMPHHDDDFGTIASVTGQPTQRLAAPGTL